MIELKDITFPNGDAIIDSSSLIIILDELNKNEYRLYYRLHYDDKNENLLGFDFCSVKLIDDFVEVLLNGIAHFDGVRHLYFGRRGDTSEDSNYGYFFYPDLNMLNIILREIKKLEDKYC